MIKPEAEVFSREKVWSLNSAVGRGVITEEVDEHLRGEWKVIYQHYAKRVNDGSFFSVITIDSKQIILRMDAYVNRSDGSKVTGSMNTRFVFSKDLSFNEAYCQMIKAIPSWANTFNIK